MRLGFMTVKDMRALPFEEVAQWGADNGFEAVDAQVEHIDTCAEIGIEVGATHLRPRVLTLDEDARVAAQQEAFAIIDEAVNKGVTRAMIPHSAPARHDHRGEHRRFRQGLRPHCGIRRRRKSISSW